MARRRPIPTAEVASVTSADAGRDSAGRFAVGNRFGLGNPNHRRLAAARAAVGEVVGSDDVADLVRVMLAQARAGDAQAARVVLEYTVGKPRQAAPDFEIDLGSADLRTAQGVAEAVGAVAKAAASGTIDTTVAKDLVGLFSSVLELAVVVDLERRLGAVEAERREVES